MAIPSSSCSKLQQLGQDLQLVQRHLCDALAALDAAKPLDVAIPVHENAIPLLVTARTEIERIAEALTGMALARPSSPSRKRSAPEEALKRSAEASRRAASKACPRKRTPCVCAKLQKDYEEELRELQ